MEADLTLEELQATMKSKGMKDIAPGPDGIPYSVYGKLWVTAGPLVLEAWKYSNEKGELSRDQLLSTIMLLDAQVHDWVANLPFRDMCWGYSK